MPAPAKKTTTPARDMAATMTTIYDLPPTLPLDVIDADPVALNDPDQTFLASIVLAMRDKNLPQAIAHTIAHLEKNAKNPAVLNLLGALHLQQRDAAGAEKYLIQAARNAQAPDPKITNNQACVHLLRGHYKTAEALLTGGRRGAKDLFAEYDYNLALAYAFQNKAIEAESTLARALQQEDLVEIYVLKARLAYGWGDTDRVEQNLRAGLEKFPASGLLHYYMAGLFLLRADISSALQHISRAFDQEPDNSHFGMLYASIVSHISFDGYNENHVRLITRALQNPGINTGLLSQAWHSLLIKSPIWNQTTTGIAAPELITQLKENGQLNTPFIQLGLRRMILKNIASENILTPIRQTYLSRVQNGEALDEQDTAFLSAIACQCHHNEYAYFESDDETKILDHLQSKLTADHSEIDALLILCCYRPILSLMTEEAALVLKDDRLLFQIVRDQVIDRRTELDLMATLPCLTPIHDDVSRAVEQMYAENPYPAWLSTQYRGNVDHLKLSPHKNQRRQLLIAGCGTGHHAIMSALSYENTQVTAIDLSRRSLAYAKRKTQELGLPHIDYAQADILEMGSMKERYDSIESVGVLHHLRDPIKGLEILLGLLKPGGLMKLGLYSEIARVNMVAGREAVAAGGYPATPAGIRAFRHDVMTEADHPAAALARNGDFHTISTCRDLVFHVQETRYTLPQIKEILANHQLEFVAFNLDVVVMDRFKKINPHPDDAKNLDLWHQFEIENQDTFANMYQFSVIKRA